MAALDHLILASPDLQAGVDFIESRTRITPAPGGPHPGIGTHNALASFDDETYFEIIGIDPDQPEPERTRPFRLDEDLPLRLAGYAIHPSEGDTIDAVAAMMAEAGHDPGAVISMSRRRPDGELVEWRLTYGGEPEPPANACLPFIIDWGTTETPALSTPRLGELIALEVTHPDDGVRDLANRLDVGLVVSEGPASLTARIATQFGELTLSS